MLRGTCSGPKATLGGMLMDAPSKEFALAGSLEELKIKGRLVVHGGHRPILVIYDRGRVFALDNRCPHMGFPLERGSVEDGILTCHWHHARFDLESGCTFDLWADDVPICPVEVRNGDVWVKTRSLMPIVNRPGVPDADRRAKLLTCLAVEGSLLDAYSHQAA
jgi:nitrite reductase/ring-hydroxylating ferredoxin subunit